MKQNWSLADWVRGNIGILMVSEIKIDETFPTTFRFDWTDEEVYLYI